MVNIFPTSLSVNAGRLQSEKNLAGILGSVVELKFVVNGLGMSSDATLSGTTLTIPGINTGIGIIGGHQIAVQSAISSFTTQVENGHIYILAIRLTYDSNGYVATAESDSIFRVKDMGISGSSTDIEDEVVDGLTYRYLPLYSFIVDGTNVSTTDVRNAKYFTGDRVATGYTGNDDISAPEYQIAGMSSQDVFTQRKILSKGTPGVGLLTTIYNLLDFIQTKIRGKNSLTVDDAATWGYSATDADKTLEALYAAVRDGDGNTFRQASANYTKLIDGKLSPSQMPIATANSLGGIKVGSGLSVAPDGTLSAGTSSTDFVNGTNISVTTDNGKVKISVTGKVANATNADVASKIKINNTDTTLLQACNPTDAPTFNGLTLNGAANTKNINANGNISATGTITGQRVYNAVYNDYAEAYPKAPDVYIEAGDIVAKVPGENLYTLALGSTRNVVGVCSDTYGHLLGGENYEDAINHCVAVAVAGQVYVKVYGTVMEGDLITVGCSSGIGVADNNAPRGTVVGKALEQKDSVGFGKIKIQVMLG